MENIRLRKGISFNKNFETNLLNASICQEIEGAKREWEFLKIEDSEEKKLCICQHKIKTVKYFFNKINGNIICCGSTCCRKFNFEKVVMNNKFLHKILTLKNLPSDLQFQTIQQYLEYSKEELARYIIYEINICISAKSLIPLYENISIIYETYHLEFLKQFMDLIKEKVIPFIPEYIHSSIFKMGKNMFRELVLEPHFELVDNMKEKLSIIVPHIDIGQIIIQNVDDYITSSIKNYSGHFTLQLKNAVEQAIELQTSILLLPLFVSRINDLTESIENIKRKNFAIEKMNYERRKEKERKMNSHKY